MFWRNRWLHFCFAWAILEEGSSDSSDRSVIDLKEADGPMWQHVATPEMVLIIFSGPDDAGRGEEICQLSFFFGGSPRKEYHNMLENIAGNSSMLVGKAAEVRC